MSARNGRRHIVNAVPERGREEVVMSARTGCRHIVDAVRNAAARRSS